eukprot:TRINITY_DN11775_c0_g1_i2.p1 TRINITY_DN11775_c0_g1~~TRINITY_DN11775_c0_g1_i2.p1  ORF type:complete len:167 (-),score=21.82 TRINITY_DN11775_c0_g1_i2:240-740(-)
MNIGTRTYKGSTKYQLTKFWRKMTEHFTFERWHDIVRLFWHDIGIGVVGVNLFCHPYPHFSGNYWWSTCEYLQTHPTPKNPSPLYKEIKSAYPRRYDEVWIFDTLPNEKKRWFAAECYRDTMPYPYGFVSELPTVFNQTCEDPRFYPLPIVEEGCLETPSTYPMFL